MVLMGQLISECSKLTDTSGENGLYFVYNDLAVRSSGFYRLKFELYQMSNVLRGSSPLAVVYSGQFQAFSPKSFPGLTHPTALSLCFARQGVSIRMRSTASGHGSGRVKRNRDDDEDD
ncbi:velvet factor [Obelidium mucronatum]|nr:velvet factor [Obelidium mucronatum]